MKLYQDKGKTILPRVDSLLLWSRLMILIGILSVMIFGHPSNRDYTVLAALSGILTLQLGLIWYLMKKDTGDIKKTFMTIIVFELIFIPVLVSLTGGYESSFYLFYYLTVTFVAYMMTFPVSMVLVGIMSVSYTLLIVRDLQALSAINAVLRIGFMWFLALTISFVAEYIRRSEKRLLKLFDTLNQRTSELEKSQAFLELIYENTRVLAGILDVDGVIEEVTKIMGDILAYPAGGLLLEGPGHSLIYRGRTIAGQSNFHLKACDPESNALVHLVAGQGDPVIVNDTRKRRDYEKLRESTRTVMLVPMIAHGRTLGVLTAESSKANAFSEKDQRMLLVVARAAGMALENAMLHQKMEEMSITDELTGIYNYRYFSEKLKEEQRRAARYNLPLSLIMLDIDWFKKFNDTYGHEVGNVVLKGITSVVKNCIRDVDVFCRYGGEEFVIILPQTPQSEVAPIGERIRHSIETSTFGGDNIPGLKVTVSVGVTSFPENGKPEEELLSIADQALYRAKGSGKNVVCVI